MIEEIHSLKDEKVQLAKAVNGKKGRIETGKCLIEGPEAIDWAIESGMVLDYILISNKHPDPEKYLPFKLYRISEGLLKKITDTNYVIPVVAVGNINPDNSLDDFCVVLDNLSDYGNIGTIVRTCHAFGIKSVISTKRDFDLFHKKTVDASRGRVFTTRLKAFPSAGETLRYLKEHNYQIVTTSPRGSQLQSMVRLGDKPVALVVGNETLGASTELMDGADLTVQIPMQSQVESLNVGVATGISIYELKLKRIIGMIEKQIRSTLGRKMNVAAMLIREVLDRELKKVSDLSSSQLIFLMVLKCDVTMRVEDAQRQFGIPDKDVEDHFRPLLDSGLISRDSSQNLAITEAGIETIGRLWTTIENTENKILEDFTEAEKKELRGQIDRIILKCDQILKNLPEGP